MDFKSPTAREIVAEYLRQLDSGALIKPEDVIAQHKELEHDLRKEFRSLRMIEHVIAGSSAEIPSTPAFANEATKSNGAVVASELRCPHCKQPTELTLEGSFRAVECDACGKTFSLIKDRKWPSHVAHFELIERIGVGGFGTVWKARDTKLDRFVAVKLPRRTFLEDSEAEQFLREAKTAANLSHKNIVRVHEVGMHDVSVYIASELIEGKSLAYHIEQGVTQKKALRWTETIARALHHAHENDVIHRDLKPQNVMVDAAGTPYLSDFGLARRADKDLTVTMTGQVLGTPGYMSPEQARGESHSADARSDVYSLGAVFYELLTGQVPFPGNPATVFQRLQQEDPINPRRLDHQISVDAATVCMKCLEKDPDKRYQTASDVADELRRISAGKPILARPVGVLGRSARWAKRNPLNASLAVGLVVLFVAAVLEASYVYSQKKISAAEALRSTAQQSALDAQNKLNAAQQEVIVVTKRQSVLNQIRQLRADATSGYRDRVFALLKDNADLVHDATLRKDFRAEAVLCMGDYAAYEPKELIVNEDQKISRVAICTNGARIAIGFASGRIELREVDELQEKAVFHANVDNAGGRLVALRFRADSSNEVLAVGEKQSLNLIQFGEETTVKRLASPAQLRLQRQLDESSVIVSANISIDGRYVALTDGMGVLLWDTLKEAKVFEEYPDIPAPLRSVALTNDGEKLAAAYSDVLGSVGGVMRWDRGTNTTLLRTLNKGTIYGNSISISDDGAWLAVGCEQSILYELDTLQERLSFQDTEVLALAFAPDSNSLAIYYISGSVELRHRQTNSLLAQVQLESDPFGNGAAFSQDNSRFVAWGIRSLKVLDLDSHTERVRIEAHDRSIPMLSYSRDGKLFTCGKDGAVRVWEFDPELRPSRPAREITGRGQVQCIALHPTEPWIAVAEWVEKEPLTIWSFRESEPRLIKSINTEQLGLICGLGFSGDGKHLAASGDNGLRAWRLDLLDGDVQAKLIWRTAPDTESTDESSRANENEDDKFLVFDKTGKRLFHADRWGDYVKCLDLTTSPPKSYDLGDPEVEQDMLVGWHGLDFTPDSRLVFVNRENGLDVWDVSQMESGGERIESIAKGTFSSPNIAINRDGLAALKAGPKSVSIWDLATKKELFALPKERNSIYALAWSPDGERLAVGLSDGGLSIWDLKKIREGVRELGFDN